MNVLTVVENETRLMRWKSMTLDLDRRTAQCGGVPIAVSPAEFNLLRLLIGRRNIPLEKDFIMSSLFGPDHGRDLRQADFFVARLRRLLAPFGLGDAISTIAGRGYTMVDDQRSAGPVSGSLALSAA